MSDHTPTHSQTVGPFFSIGLSALCRKDIDCGATAGERVKICGRVLDGDGVPTPDALLEIWHLGVRVAGEPEMQGAPAQRGNFPLGFGRIPTNAVGEYQFTTNKPAVRRDADGTVHAPHLVVVLFMRGLLRHLITRIYFADEASNANDPVLNLVPCDRRGTLLAKKASSGESDLLWDIHLQGENETVFFDV
jgi:protocatechuate 3,4-dioxygenase, alpha subunit